MVALAIVVFVQLFLESLPVSSSGHIRLLECYLQYLQKTFNFIDFDFYKPVELCLHLPSALIYLFFLGTSLKKELKLFCKAFWNNVLAIFVADFITFLFFIFFKSYLSTFPLLIGFLITALLLFSSATIKNGFKEQISLLDGTVLGIAQGLALAPGISRLGITYVSSLYLGFNKKFSLAISLILAVPIFFAGTLKGCWALSENHLVDFIATEVIASFIVAGIMAFFALKFLLWLIEINRFWLISIYMLFPILLSFFCL